MIKHEHFDIFRHVHGLKVGCHFSDIAPHRHRRPSVALRPKWQSWANALGPGNKNHEMDFWNFLGISGIKKTDKMGKETDKLNFWQKYFWENHSFLSFFVPWPFRWHLSSSGRCPLKLATKNGTAFYMISGFRKLPHWKSSHIFSARKVQNGSLKGSEVLQNGLALGRACFFDRPGERWCSKIGELVFGLMKWVRIMVKWGGNVKTCQNPWV